ncbi:tetratricopeptide repeat protein [Flavobacterium sp.]|uniref:tetratricopeptide repeat protein n=1 Tax=Flavobacterium sp. TaxID=239 RepID=UPI00286BCE62|nr:tetratricopeptide repeat protein [Flavobacterium sp.]
MNVAEYTHLLNKPDTINFQQVISLEKILVDFPYFQSARSLHLKGLYKQDSFKYNQNLKNTAAFTTDRTVLFDLITSENFIGIQKGFYEEKEANLLDINVVDSLTLDDKKAESSLEKSIISSITESNLIVEVNENKEKVEEEIVAIAENFQTESSNIEEENLVISEKLEIGKPLTFDHSETHSFEEWLQLSKARPIVRVENTDQIKLPENNLNNKLEIIDKFIEANPKISPVNKESFIPTIAIKEEETSYLMTETLAKVYLEQKKYSKAIQAYEILILKYPEKSSFFAIRISDIKMLQQNNNN